MAKDWREPWTHVPEPLRSQVLSECDLKRRVLAQLRRYPDQDPFQNQGVIKLAHLAFDAYRPLNPRLTDDDFGDYLEQTSSVHEDIAQALGGVSLSSA